MKLSPYAVAARIITNISSIEEHLIGLVRHKARLSDSKDPDAVELIKYLDKFLMNSWNSIIEIKSNSNNFMEEKQKQWRNKRKLL